MQRSLGRVSIPAFLFSLLFLALYTTALGTLYFNKNEFLRWYKQAEHNLASSERDGREGEYDWACFKAQQAAEIAVKAIIAGFGKLQRGHSVHELLRILEGFGLRINDDLYRCAKKLDRFYIPTRYPDAIGIGSPFESFDEDDYSSAIRCSKEILKFVKELSERF